MKKKEYTFIDILNDPRGKQLIEAIEYVIGDANAGNKDKQETAESYAADLLEEFGYDYFAIHKEW